MGVFLLFGNGLTFTGTARRRFSPLSAGSSVLDDLWIVVIILEQPAYALIVPSRPIRFWLLILSLQVLPQNKIKLISSEKKLPQLFNFIWAPRTEVPGLNDIKKLRCQTSPRARVETVQVEWRSFAKLPCPRSRGCGAIHRSS